MNANPYESPRAPVAKAPDRVASVGKGRWLFLGIATAVALLECIGLYGRPITDSDVLRVTIVFGLLTAIWLGQQWAIVLVALGALLNVITAIGLGLAMGTLSTVVAGIGLSIFYAVVFWLFVNPSYAAALHSCLFWG